VLSGVVLIRDVGVPNRLLRVGGVCAWFEFHTFDPRQHENEVLDRRHGAGTHTYKSLTGIANIVTSQATWPVVVFGLHAVG
jgi:hypothetical protein